MNITEGIVWERKNDTWVKTVDNWPFNRRGARITANGDDAFGQYGKAEAIDLIEGWIAGGLPEKYETLAIIPGKEMSATDKEKLVEFNKRKKAERGESPEPAPVESYVS